MKASRHLILTPLAAAMAIVLAANPVFAVNDKDRDGVSDSDEKIIGTLDYDPDTDRGGANDGWEIANGFDPLDPTDDHLVPEDLDSDNDGIADRDEDWIVFDKDSDQDGIPDTIEAGLIDADYDGFLDDLSDINNNGMPDVAEALAVSGNYPDSDNDGTPDYLDNDADNDGLKDHYEHNYENVPDDFTFDRDDIDGDGLPNRKDPDSDGDGKLDGEEFKLVGSYYGYTYLDTDGDGVPDHFDSDDSAAYIPLDTELDKSSDDMDRDGLANTEEALLGTDPYRADSDAGGVLDDWEVANGFDPLDPTDDATIPPDFDIDNDGVLNEHEGQHAKDADSDGDGISDANEVGLPDADNDGFLDDLTDVNNNGMPDVAEALAISSPNPYPDTDGDGYDNHLDADSDNDGVYDSLENDTSWVPEGFVGNPLDIDGDGLNNSVDLDSDGDGISDFEEQKTAQLYKYDADDGVYINLTPTSSGQIHQLSDDDGDGLSNLVDIDSYAAGADNDGDGVYNMADIDSAVYYVPNYNTWEDGWQLDQNGNPIKRANSDVDGDGIEDRYDLDIGNNGALDMTADVGFKVDADQDGIPAIYDIDDQVAYVAPIPNSAPELTQTAPQNLTVSSEHAVDLSQISFVDADNDELSFRVTLNTGEALPEWLSFDPTTQLMTVGDAPESIEGVDLTFIADDGMGGETSTSIYIAITRASVIPESETELEVTEPQDAEAVDTEVTEESPMVTTVDAESTPILTEEETAAPETGAAASTDANGGAGAFGIWGLLVLLFARIGLSIHRPQSTGDT